ncbi:hypothetical protein K493DRAFT_318348 [Basidiobolus meristosporus CBS 931.73]|uniref:Calcineurin-like phosphoesterase domain-containing protein n=1 Tax=Basidiobolus meristosporus CBS 931.73 TaxID=1314790 RepID=A0A1Y1WZM9_9FUNG|nr:hypothetical protein K493DRAFT_321108 [Basidiobolus meristosporus CBS 931.73]ORX89881.1 hypothetical protein K493DRAFT_318348 [Basidiobolus meristosporus CBS 931.73]|eukprot:ORX79029.1 hypothetical protein K493DRAFT_321108 [Basidiobolus meristosporus CBS 931.73]
MVTKGPDSVGTLARAKEINALCVRGNHEDLVLRWRNRRKGKCNIDHGGNEHRRLSR